jgi:capsular polysaccharide transport system permease protein
MALTPKDNPSQRAAPAGSAASSQKVDGLPRGSSVTNVPRSVPQNAPGKIAPIKKNQAGPLEPRLVAQQGKLQRAGLDNAIAKSEAEAAVSWHARLREWTPAPALVSISPAARLRARARRFLPYACLVILPTMAVALYVYLVAADQYQTEIHFDVTTISSAASESQSGNSSNSALSTMLMSSAQGAGSLTETETLTVLDFMQSRDAMSGLKKKLDLEKIYRRPRFDLINRIPKNATVERIYKYFFSFWPMIDAYFDYNYGVGVIQVTAFRPAEAKQVADTLMNLADNLVNEMNDRSEKEALRVAKNEVIDAEKRVEVINKKVTDFRVANGSMDPDKSSSTLLSVIATLEGNLAQARADLSSAAIYMKPESPPFVQMKNRVAALNQQIENEKIRLTGTAQGMAPLVAAYQQLLLDLQFANQDYNTALQSLESARLETEKQHLFLVQNVRSSEAEEAEYPRRFLIVGTSFVGLSLLFGIAWLILAGVREHAG